MDAHLPAGVGQLGGVLQGVCGIRGPVAASRAALAQICQSLAWTSFEIRRLGSLAHAPSLLIAVIYAVANIKTMPVQVMMKIPLEAQNILHAPDMANKARKWVGDWHLEKTIATIKARVEGAYHAL